MTRDNRRKNIAAEVRGGNESLDSARLLLAAGKHADAVSRAYYAAFHYTRATGCRSSRKGCAKAQGGQRGAPHVPVAAPLP